MRCEVLPGVHLAALQALDASCVVQGPLVALQGVDLALELFMFLLQGQDLLRHAAVRLQEVIVALLELFDFLVELLCLCCTSARARD